MNFLLQVTKDDYASQIIKTKSFGEAALFGLEIVAIGMCAVFAVLGIIWLSLLIFNKLMPGVKQKKEPAIKAPQAVTSAPTAPAATADTNAELVAVIAAAIAAAESESSGAKFRVVSFKRK